MTDSAHAAEPPESAAGDADERVRSSTGSEPTRTFDHDRIREGVRAIFEGLGLDAADPVVQDTPERFARMCDEVFGGLLVDPRRTLDVVFEEGHDEIIMERDIPVASLCVPSKQHVNAVGGVKCARDVGAGDLLWTFDPEGRLARTEVVSVRSRKTKEMVRVRAGSGPFELTPEHPVRIREGWKPAGELEPGEEVRWTPSASPQRTVATRRVPVGSSQLGGPGWEGEPGLQSEDTALLPADATWAPVETVERVDATGTKPYTVYSFQCRPHPTFLVAGVLTHNCEHHLLPFVGRAHVGYLPNTQGQITGVSKLARLVDIVCKRPNLQERITTTVADVLEEALEPRGVICIIEAEHMCMTMRGVKKPGAVTVTSAVRGAMRDSHRTREEAMTLALGHRRLGT